MEMGQISANRNAVQVMEKGSGGCRSMSNKFVLITISMPRSFTMAFVMVTRKCIIRWIYEYSNEQLYSIFSIGYKLSINFGIGIGLLADQLKNGEFLSFVRGRVRSMDIESETTGSKSMPNIPGCSSTSHMTESIDFMIFASCVVFLFLPLSGLCVRPSSHPQVRPSQGSDCLTGVPTPLLYLSLIHILRDGSLSQCANKPSILEHKNQNLDGSGLQQTY